MQALLAEFQQQSSSTTSDDALLKQFVLSDYSLEQIIKIHRTLTTPSLSTNTMNHHLLLVGSLGNRLSMLVRLALFLTGGGMHASGIDKPIRPVTLNLNAKASIIDQCRGAFRSLLTEDKKIALISNVWTCI